MSWLKHKTQVIGLNIQDQVVFCGFLNENEMIELQNKCHVFVHAAKKHEPYGLVVIDNLSMGIPVIATNVTGAAIDRIKMDLMVLLLNQMMLIR
ncbi:MAG: glycosyltransferase [Saprospiraceae bacterium]|nr:glycosyltransferase [Candidatus Brachybacter algidus]MBL0120394.1 glycosyltransferase [Candidatus Brachybacter algidus]